MPVPVFCVDQQLGKVLALKLSVNGKVIVPQRVVASAVVPGDQVGVDVSFEKIL